MAVTRLRKPVVTGRKASKEVRRRQLIDATIDVLAKRGFADLTLADVADQAGLSRGIVNFHFESKDKLLIETLRHMAETYHAHWQYALHKSGASVQEKLWAVVAADFDKAVCNRKTIAAWSVMRAEAKSRPLYRAICGHHDASFQATLDELIRDLVAAEQQPSSPQQLALGLDCLLEGLWMQLLMQPSLTRKDAHLCAIEHLVVMFPGQFSHSGPVL